MKARVYKAVELINLLKIYTFKTERGKKILSVMKKGYTDVNKNKTWQDARKRNTFGKICHSMVASPVNAFVKKEAK